MLSPNLRRLLAHTPGTEIKVDDHWPVVLKNYAKIGWQNYGEDNSVFRELFPREDKKNPLTLSSKPKNNSIIV